MSSSDHFPWATQLLLALHADGELPNVAEILVEPRYGVIGQLRYRDGGVRPFTGNGLEGLNNAAAARIARDKGWTRYLLGELGYSCPPGEKFVLDDFAERLNRRLSRPKFAGYLHERDAPAFARDKYPVYLKPARGSKGRGVFRCQDEAELDDVIAYYRETADKVESFVVEQAVTMPDYRVIVLDGVVRCAYERRPLAITGDGVSSVLALVEERQMALTTSGRPDSVHSDDARLVRNVAAAGYDLDAVLPEGVHLELLEVSNLSAGGSLIDHSDDIADRWADLSIKVTRDFGLELCGVDLACADITVPSDDYAILELNASPGVDHYVSQGAVQESVVRALFRDVFNRSPA